MVAKDLVNIAANRDASYQANNVVVTFPQQFRARFVLFKAVKVALGSREPFWIEIFLYRNLIGGEKVQDFGDERLKYGVTLTGKIRLNNRKIVGRYRFVRV